MKRLEGIEAALFKPELTVANKTSRAIPFRSRVGFERRINAGAVIGKITALADSKPTGLFRLAAVLTSLSIQNLTVSRFCFTSAYILVHGVGVSERF